MSLTSRPAQWFRDTEQDMKLILIHILMGPSSLPVLPSPAVGGCQLPLVPEAEPGLRDRPPEGAGVRLLGPGAPPAVSRGYSWLDHSLLRLGLDDGEEPRSGRQRWRRRGGD